MASAVHVTMAAPSLTWYKTADATSRGLIMCPCARASGLARINFSDIAARLTARSRSAFIRYGIGAEAGGLLKPMAAMRNSDAMLALYMPETPIKATDPASPRGVGAQPAGQAQMPTFPRRHYFLWRLTMQEKRVGIQELDGGIPQQPSPKKVFADGRTAAEQLLRHRSRWS